MTYLLKSEAETLAVAERMGRQLKSGDCIVLTGELGAGKTTFTKGLAKGLDIEQMVKSPTYTIVREYRKGRLPLFHMDVYRLEDGAGDLGLEDYFESEGVSIVEWGQMIKEDLPESYVELTLSYLSETNTRELGIAAVGPNGLELKNRLEVVS
ncbi:tRNA (adenosine(37)-N6)-threonylcarbamoyltransferase complex ATPase subunit type 1 TsaE [Vagococcus intermedius]|uniref:tRNA threonylcarbamoyladenosine biosynthesis protein TsaE n=1 Tax=Vagococcus intermedius TaxID=2991418 RepID=A0AAF0CUN8_9ENTE|nr:tRNA (adenosine(37)-N6)-threonylcarbamoyltransferase complex ATPase subunit type 1 TsaE [Vagococcus intermedius]WEG73284.1 tRNA (adenosine(37)-N6)-threonylcarbamoyltransferase complex ATPase subunit type 1 TsaE [Vagococcus intermedius]WEG75365.1 tRNA (adenosine(37)-N6)-threonylcarbamoyltransferase complex ATPase subunit type 1 TsaE [Vagococcus intermedius]